MPSPRLDRTATLAAALLLGLTSAVHAQTPDTSSFVATLGRDTVCLERYTLGREQLDGTSLVAYPAATLRSYAASFGPDGRLQRVHVAIGPAGGEPTTTADYVYGSDSVRVAVHRDTLARWYSVATGGARPLPFFEDVFGFFDLEVRSAMATGADSTSFGLLAGRHILTARFRRLGARAVEFEVPGWGTVHAELDAGGRLRGLDMTGTTTKYNVRSAPSVDLRAAAATWAARPQPGSLSPRDTASATIGAARVVVDYGRPSMRGRKVFGGIVPFGKIWRTGANAATQLITNRDLVIGGKSVPAGTYSLFTIPGPSAWTLIINRQHGQWGTQYDPGRDLVRVPVAISHADTSLERFTITVQGDPSGTGSISFAWERTRATVAVSADRGP